MLKFFDRIIADWSTFTWEYNGTTIEQVRVSLYDGSLLIMDVEDFLTWVDDD